MNMFTRFGNWLEFRRIVRWPELSMLEKSIAMRFDVLEAEKQVPSGASKEINLLKARLDRIELLVGLKREPVLQQLPDTPRIS